MTHNNEDPFFWIENELKEKIAYEFESWENFIIEAHEEVKYTKLSAVVPLNKRVQDKWRMHTDAYWPKLEKLKALGIDKPRDFLMKIHERIIETWSKPTLKEELLGLGLSDEEVKEFLRRQDISKVG